MIVNMVAQPDDVTCGPTSLYAVYHALGYECELQDIIDDVRFLEEGGTLAAFLGIDALRRGFHARIYSYNLHLFDPTWSVLEPAFLVDKLHEQRRHKHDRKLRVATEAYVRFLELGGDVRFDVLTPGLLRTYFDRGLPVLAGLSATYLYNTRREVALSDLKTAYDDMQGEPAGHFVVLCGFSERGVLVADPYRNNPFTGNNRYEVELHRLLNAILLGIATYDANLLIISREPLP